MDKEKIKQIIAKFRDEPTEIIQILLAIQHETGWLSREILESVSEILGTPFGKVHQTATFYKAFRIVPRGKHVVHVCKGTACQTRGAQSVVDAVGELLGLKPGETDLNEKFTLETSNCLGRCALGPVVDIGGTTYPKVSPEAAKDVLKKYE